MQVQSTYSVDVALAIRACIREVSVPNPICVIGFLRDGFHLVSADVLGYQFDMATTGVPRNFWFLVLLQVIRKCMNTFV